MDNEEHIVGVEVEVVNQLEVIEGEVIDDLNRITWEFFRDPLRQQCTFKLAYTDEFEYQFPYYASELRAMMERIEIITREANRRGTQIPGRAQTD